MRMKRAVIAAAAAELTCCERIDSVSAAKGEKGRAREAGEKLRNEFGRGSRMGARLGETLMRWAMPVESVEGDGGRTRSGQEAEACGGGGSEREDLVVVVVVVSVSVDSVVVWTTATGFSGA